jgi:hypothetical protein
MNCCCRDECVKNSQAVRLRELLDEAIGRRSNGRKIMTMPKAAVLRSLVMNHLIHHRAQLGAYLRLFEHHAIEIARLGDNRYNQPLPGGAIGRLGTTSAFINRGNRGRSEEETRNVR